MFATIKLIKIFLAVTATLLLVSGCEQSENVTIHEPGVYQGASDSSSTDLAALQERMKKQMDR